MMRSRELSMDVVTAARKRITNIFANGLPVYLSFSGGKDSLALAHLTLELARAGAIDKSLIRMEFIDEEAIFPCVERINREWRDRIIDLGGRFDWYCLEVKHYSCLNLLENDESFICWDSTKQDVWVRERPDFAIIDHPLLKPRTDSYQEFLNRISDGLHMTGVRAAESIQRRDFLSRIPSNGIADSKVAVHPIFDWMDSDVWRYLSDHQVAIPDAYLYLYQIGSARRNLRISQFFSIDTVATLSRISQFYPGLMERILRREPSAYLVSLYWNSEMFRRKSPTRTTIEAGDEPIDQKKRLLDMLENPPEQVLRNEAALSVLRSARTMLLRMGPMMVPEHYRLLCEALITGDPKKRVIRALYSNIAKKSSPSSTASGRQRADRAARQPGAERLQPKHRALGQSGAA